MGQPLTRISLEKFFLPDASSEKSVWWLLILLGRPCGIWSVPSGVFHAGTASWCIAPCSAVGLGGLELSSGLSSHPRHGVSMEKTCLWLLKPE